MNRSVTRFASMMLALLVIVGCSASSDHAEVSPQGRSASDRPAEGFGGSAPAGPTVDDAPSGDRAAADDDAGGPTQSPEGETSVDTGSDELSPLPASTGRRVIRTAELVLEVDDPAAAADDVVAIAERARGFVAETDLERDREGVVSGTIVLRVPTAALNDTVDELDALGDAVPVRRIDETDVTAETTDLEAQRSNLTAYEDELRALLADVRETTTRPDDLLTVFERIRQVRAELDQIDARLAVLTDQVALSTIHVHIRPTVGGVSLTDPTWQPADTIRRAMASTARALTGLADAAIWLVLTVLPIVAVVGSPLIVGLLFWRRRRSTVVSGTPADAPTPPPSG